MLALPRIARSGRDDPKIVIVGAGIAGLTCAVRLADRGIAATVYEASGRACGRMVSNTSTWADNQVTEWCGELIDTGHDNIRELAHRFNLQLDDLIAAQPPRTEDTYFFQDHFYPKARSDVDFAPVFDAVTADEASAPFPTTFDNFNQLPGFMEGGAEQGRRAARELARLIRGRDDGDIFRAASRSKVGVP